MKLRVSPRSWGTCYTLHCPACNSPHIIHCHTDDGQPSWTFDGDLENPTFEPSILCQYGRPDDPPPEPQYAKYMLPKVCHFFVRKGRIEFLGDCTHRLAGQTVDLVECSQQWWANP